LVAINLSKIQNFNFLGQIQAPAVDITKMLRYNLQSLAGHLLIAGFGGYIAFVYAVPYSVPKVRQFESESFLQSLRYRYTVNWKSIWLFIPRILS